MRFSDSHAPRALILFLALTGGLSGCGLTRKVAIGTLVPVLHQTIETTYRSDDVVTVREGIPGNLLVLRGLCESEPKNEEIRILAVQTTFSYAYGFVEDEDPERAVRLYEEGVRLGRGGLERKDWFRRADAGRPLPDSLALARMPVESVPLLFWTLANWASWVSWNLTDPAAVAQLPRIEAYLRRVLELDPAYFHGMPHVLTGTILTFRPKMLGGDPERGQAHFEEALRISNRRMLFFQVMYARYFCRQALDEECFDRHLDDVLNAPRDLFPDYRLLNEVARVKALRLKERRDEYF